MEGFYMDSSVVLQTTVDMHLLLFLLFIAMATSRPHTSQTQKAKATSRDPRAIDFENPIPELISFDPNDVHFFLNSNKKNEVKRIEIVYNNVTSLMNAGLVRNTKIIFYTFGFLRDSIAELKPGTRLPLEGEYRARGIKNTIYVDWGKLAKINTSVLPTDSPLQYLFIPLAQKGAVIAGRRLAEFIDFLQGNGIVQNFDYFHLIGLSLGAHMMGAAAYHVEEITGEQVGRLTGLEVGIFNELYPPAWAFHKGSAKFVDALHTSQVLGVTESVGTVDFWANGGKDSNQHGCDSAKGKFPDYIYCTHNASLAIYERSILGEKLKGCRCKKSLFPLVGTPCPKPKSCRFPVLFGEDGSTTVKGNYYLPVPLR